MAFIPSQFTSSSRGSGDSGEIDCALSLVGLQAILQLQRDRVRRVDQKLSAELRERFDTLTAREQQVMSLVVAGRLNKQIAAELRISEMTAKIHRAQVFRKMQAVNLPDLVRMADKFGIANIKA
jgi:FixJ family two-component response regulator